MLKDYNPVRVCYIHTKARDMLRINRVNMYIVNFVVWDVFCGIRNDNKKIKFENISILYIHYTWLFK